jgi:hypothetical protein
MHDIVADHLSLITVRAHLDVTAGRGLVRPPRLGWPISTDERRRSSPTLSSPLVRL